MGNDGLRFYQIFSFGGTIGVNSLSFGEVILSNIIGIALLFLIIGLIATFLPFIILAIYFLYVLIGNSPAIDLTRIRLNIFGIISYIYFLVDYHFGFIGCTVINHYLGKDVLDKLCYVNTGLAIINLILIFFANKIYNDIQSGFMRLLVLSVFLYFVLKLFTGISSEIMPNIVSQFDFEAYEKSKEEKVKENKKDEWVFNEDYLNEEYGTNKEKETLEYVGPLD
jgi:hypothetical protein